MKTITLDYTIYARKTFTIPKDWQKWFDIWEKDEGDRTNREWDYLEKHTLAEFVSKMINSDVEEVEVWNYE